jgi:hypothetical protein
MTSVTSFGTFSCTLSHARSRRTDNEDSRAYGQLQLQYFFIHEDCCFFWVVMSCSLVEVYRRFRGVCCLHHQGATTQKTAIFILAAMRIWNLTSSFIFVLCVKWIDEHIPEGRFSPSGDMFHFQNCTANFDWFWYLGIYNKSYLVHLILIRFGPG